MDYYNTVLWQKQICRKLKKRHEELCELFFQEEIYSLEAKMMPIDLRKLSRYQVKKLMISITSNYAVSNKRLLAYFFEKELC